MTSEELDRLIEEELEAVLDEKSSKSARRKRKKKRAKKKAKRDACYHKVKSRYKVWPSAYASGALVKCRKVGAKNWGNKSKKNEGLNEQQVDDKIINYINNYIAQPAIAKTIKDPLQTPKAGYPGKPMALRWTRAKDFVDGLKAAGASWPENGYVDYITNVFMQMNNELNEDEESPLHKVAMALDSEGGAAGLNKLVELTGLSKEKVKDVIDNTKYIDVHKAGDVVELTGLEEDMDISEGTITLRLAQMEDLDEKKKKKKKKPCKKAKGKRYVKRVNGRCRSFGQAGKAKGGGDRIRPGTKKGDAYCARSAKIKKCKNPPCANDLSRKKWKCRGSKSMRENEQE